MIKILFACLNELDGNFRCNDTNCIFNSQGKCPRCEYFDDEDKEEVRLYVREKQKDNKVCSVSSRDGMVRKIHGIL